MKTISALIFLFFLSGCVSIDYGAPEHTLTVGAVQREIHTGMSGADVAFVLGSPNIVTTDGARNEVWIYDKISTERVETEQNGADALLRLFPQLTPLADSFSRQTESVSQRTLTVIIKFDADQRVYDFDYHASRF